MQLLFLKYSGGGAVSFPLAAFVFILKRNASPLHLKFLQRDFLKHILHTYEKDNTTPSNISKLFTDQNLETPEACNPQLNKETAFLKLVFPCCFPTLILVISVIQFF